MMMGRFWGLLGRRMSTGAKVGENVEPVVGGSLYAFGSNGQGTLGLGPVSIPRSSRANAVQFATLDGSSPPRIEQMAAGNTHAIALSKDGRVWVWGSHEYGKLGLGRSVRNPQNVATCIPDAAFASQLPRFQDDHSSSISSTSSTTTDNNSKSKSSDKEGEKTSVRVSSVSAGAYASGAVFSDGSAMTWGYGGGWVSGDGPLGHGQRTDEWSPKLVDGLVGEKVVQLRIGHQHAGAVIDSGEVFMWGKGAWGRLGLGTSYSAPRPAYVHAFRNTRITHLALGQNHSLALSHSGQIYCWGKNEHFQLGLGLDSAGAYYGGSGFDAVSTPTPIPFFDSIPVRQIAANAFYSACVTVDGRAYVWGNRLFLQPARVVLGRNLDEKAQFIDAGPMHLAVVSESGKLYTFGRNADFQLGSTNRAFRKEFLLSDAIEFPVQSVSCGGAFTLVSPASP